MALLGETWTGTVACGHEYTADLSDVAVDRRAGRVRFLVERGRCTACFREDRDKERAAERRQWVADKRAEELEAATAFEAAAGMPVLDGSTKQLQWGRRVRYELLVAAHDSLVFGADTSEETYVTQVEERARLVTRASWWIDNRDAEPSDLPTLLVAAIADPSNLAACENDA